MAIDADGNYYPDFSGTTDTSVPVDTSIPTDTSVPVDTSIPTDTSTPIDTSYLDPSGNTNGATGSSGTGLIPTDLGGGTLISSNFQPVDTSWWSDPGTSIQNTPWYTDVQNAASTSGLNLGNLAGNALKWLSTGNNLQTVLSGAGGIAAFLQANGAQKTSPTDQATAQYQAMSNLLHTPKMINGQQVDLYGAINGIVPLSKKQIAYTGDPLKYGQVGQGGEHQWFDNANPMQYIPGGALAQTVPTTAVIPPTPTPAPTPTPTPVKVVTAPMAGLVSYKKGGDVKALPPNLSVIPPRPKGYVQGAGTGQSDNIKAQLSDGEYVVDSDVVSALGDGSNKAGAAALDQMREDIRKHKRSADPSKIPPPAKTPQAYLKGRK